MYAMPQSRSLQTAIPEYGMASAIFGPKQRGLFGFVKQLLQRRRTLRFRQN